VPYRLLLSLVLAAGLPLAAAGKTLAAEKANVADCTWQPFKMFTNGHVKAPPEAAKNEPLYLRKEPSYAAILPGTAPFDWTNAACTLWPGMQLRIADWGGPKDRFAKVYYDGLIFWVSKTYSDGSPTMLPVAAQSSAERDERPRKRSGSLHSNGSAR
jgi:hypothetical protein